MVSILLLAAAVVALSSPDKTISAFHLPHPNARGQRVSAAPTCRSIIDERYPRQYVAYNTFGNPPVIDGDVHNDPAWQEVPWSEDFVDISTNLIPPQRTRAKVRYDSDTIYLAFEMTDDAVWTDILETCHCVNNSQDQVIFHYNDIEFFIDSAGSTHGYKESEHGASGAGWNLLLDRPYQDGGGENSTRIIPPSQYPWDYHPYLRKAVKILGGGALNDPYSAPTGWTFEVAVPVWKIVEGVPPLPNRSSLYPAPGVKNMYRINFSRVQYQKKVVNGRYELVLSCQTCDPPGSASCDNWVYAPTRAVDIHIPELWAFLEFSNDPPATAAPTQNTEWPARYVAHIMYYAQKGYQAAHNDTYSGSIADLLPYAADDVEVLSGDCTRGAPTIELLNNGQQYVMTIPSLEFNGVITISDLRLTVAHYFSD